MMIDQVVTVAWLVGGITLAVTSLAHVLGATIYDLQSTRRHRQQQIHPHARRYRQRPLLTVVIMAKNHEQTIERCLDSLYSSSYRKLQVIVIDNASHDNTKKLTSVFIANHPKLNVRLIAKRRASVWALAIRQAYKTYGQGELVVTLDAAFSVERQALRHLVDYANNYPEVSVLTARRRPVAAASLGGLLQTYLGFLRQRSGKAAGIVHRNYDSAQDVTCCRRGVLTKLLKPADRSSVKRIDDAVLVSATARRAYVHEAIINELSSSSYYQVCYRHYRAQLNKFRQDRKRAGSSAPYLATPSALLMAGLNLTLGVCSGLMALLTPLLITYFIFLAVILHEPLFLILSMALLSTLLAFAIWEDRQLKFRQQLAYILGIPITYSLFYGFSWVRLLTACQAVMVSRLA